MCLGIKLTRSEHVIILHCQLRIQKYPGDSRVVCLWEDFLKGRKGRPWMWTVLVIPWAGIPAWMKRNKRMWTRQQQSFISPRFPNLPASSPTTPCSCCCTWTFPHCCALLVTDTNCDPRHPPSCQLSVLLILSQWREKQLTHHLSCIIYEVNLWISTNADGLKGMSKWFHY